MIMMPMLAVTLATVLLQPAAAFERRVFTAADGSIVRYAVALPPGYDPARSRPLVVALHPGGTVTPFFGDRYMRDIFYPGLRDMEPIMLAPDCPARAWTDPRAEALVLSLVTKVIDEFAIDRRRIAVVGFSMGGRGAWFLSARHADTFTAAIVMAANSQEPVTELATIPTYVIHSRADEVVPFAPAEERVDALERLGRTVRLERLNDIGHYDMPRYLGALERAGRWVRDRWGRPAGNRVP
jgi:predicted peptidase